MPKSEQNRLAINITIPDYDTVMAQLEAMRRLMERIRIEAVEAATAIRFINRNTKTKGTKWK